MIVEPIQLFAFKALIGHLDNMIAQSTVIRLFKKIKTTIFNVSSKLDNFFKAHPVIR